MSPCFQENLESTFSRNPWKQKGGYVKRAQGIRVFFKVENPPQKWIHKLFVGEEKVRPEKVYRAAFITEQGVPARFGNHRQQHPEKMVAVMQSYLAKNEPLETGFQNTSTVI